MSQTRLALMIVIGLAGCTRAPEQPKDQRMTEAEVFYRKGTELLDSEPTQAIEMLTKSLELGPDAPPALYNRAAAYARVGRDAEAVADVERLETIAPDIGKQLRSQLRLSAGGYTSIAEAEYTKGNYAVAIQKCDSALAYNPQWGDAWVVKGLAFRQLRDPEKALECFNKGAEVDPDNYSAYMNRAQLHQDEKRWQDALTDYDKAVELRPTEPGAYAGRAIVYAALNLPDKAAADESKVKELKTQQQP